MSMLLTVPKTLPIQKQMSPSVHESLALGFTDYRIYSFDNSLTDFETKDGYARQPVADNVNIRGFCGRSNDTGLARTLRSNSIQAKVNSSVTISAWYRRKEIGATQHICGYNRGSGYTFRLGAIWAGSTQRGLRFDLVTSGGNFFLAAGDDNWDMSLPFDQWNHFAGTWNAATGIMRGYVNGRLYREVNHPTGIGATLDYAAFLDDGLVINGFRYSGAGSGDDTEINRINIFDRELQPEEIYSLYLVPRSTSLTIPTNLTPAPKKRIFAVPATVGAHIQRRNLICHYSLRNIQPKGNVGFSPPPDYTGAPHEANYAKGDRTANLTWDQTNSGIAEKEFCQITNTPAIILERRTDAQNASRSMVWVNSETDNPLARFAAPAAHNRFAISFWWNQFALNGTDITFSAEIGQAKNRNSCYQLYNRGSTWQWNSWGNGTTPIIPIPSLNQWHHMLLCFVDDQLRWFQNGEELPAGPTSETNKDWSGPNGVSFGLGSIGDLSSARSGTANVRYADPRLYIGADLDVVALADSIYREPQALLDLPTTYIPTTLPPVPEPKKIFAVPRSKNHGLKKGLQFHVHASASNGAFVDLSPHKRQINLVAAGAATAAPTVITGDNGLKAFRYNGTQTASYVVQNMGKLAQNTTDADSERTIVVRIARPNRVNSMFWGVDDGTQFNRFWYYANDQGSWTGQNEIIHVPPNGTENLTTLIYANRPNPTVGQVFLNAYQDNVQYLQSNRFHDNSYTFNCLGSRCYLNGTSFMPEGDIYEVAVFDRTLSEEERQIITDDPFALVNPGPLYIPTDVQPKDPPRIFYIPGAKKSQANPGPVNRFLGLRDVRNNKDMVEEAATGILPLEYERTRFSYRTPFAPIFPEASTHWNAASGDIDWTKSFSMSFWFLKRAPISGNSSLHATTSSNSPRVTINDQTDGVTISGRIRGSSSASGWSTQVVTPYNQWVHFVFNYDHVNLEVSVYRNGEFHELNTVAQWATAGNTPFRLFGREGNQHSANSMAVDDIQLYDRLLEPREVFEIFKSGGLDTAPAYVPLPQLTGITLFVQNTVHSHHADLVTVDSPTTSLSVNDTQHTHQAENVQLVTITSLQVKDGEHNHDADKVFLLQLGDLVVQPTSHTHNADEVSLLQIYELGVSDTQHTHRADQASILQGSEWEVSSTSHTHEAQTVDFTQIYELAVSDTRHTHNAERSVISMVSPLSVLNAEHTHEADRAGMFVGVLWMVKDTRHTHQAQQAPLMTIVELGVQDTQHSHETDVASLITLTGLAVQDTQHGHEAQLTFVPMGSGLVVSNAEHLHQVNTATFTLIEVDTKGGVNCDTIIEPTVQGAFSIGGSTTFDITVS